MTTKNFKLKLYLGFLVFLAFFRRWIQKLSKPNLSFLPRSKFIYLMLLLIGFSTFSLKLRFDSQKPVVSEGIIGLYNINNLPPAVTNLLSQPLVAIDKNYKPYPQLASGWQVNSDSTVYTFTLKDNLYWHDQTKLKSEDLKFNLPDVSVKYLDDKTIEFHLADSFVPFPSLLSAPVFKNNSLLGLGKYQITDLKLVKEKVKERNLIASVTLLPQDKDLDLPKVVIRFYPDEATAKTAFELGEVDSLLGVQDLSNFKDSPTVKALSWPNFSKVIAIFYNTKDQVLSDKNLRRSLSYAIPEFKGEISAKSPIQPLSWAFNPDLKDYSNNLELAKTNLAKVEHGKDKQITLTVTNYLGSSGEKVVNAWRALGLDVVLRVEAGNPQNFQALMIGQTLPTDPDQYALWHSTQEKTNLSQFTSNKRIDKDLEDGRKTADLTRRKQYYFDFQKVLLDESPAAFLYYPKINVVYRAKAKYQLNKLFEVQSKFLKLLS